MQTKKEIVLCGFLDMLVFKETRLLIELRKKLLTKKKSKAAKEALDKKKRKSRSRAFFGPTPVFMFMDCTPTEEGARTADSNKSHSSLLPDPFSPLHCKHICREQITREPVGRGGFGSVYRYTYRKIAVARKGFYSHADEAVVRKIYNRGLKVLKLELLNMTTL